MAGDGISLAGDMITTRCAEKVVRIDEKTIVGCAGDRSICELVFQWFKDGEDKPPDFHTHEEAG